jgi:ubiquinone/menaquinone biosynthesis C-methylase UbiE
VSHHHGLYARTFAWFMARGSGTYEALAKVRKSNLLEGLTGTLLEIGSGTGANLPYLPAGLRTVGLDPNPFMHGYHQSRARGTGRPPLLVLGQAESLPFPNDSLDAVLSTLVLCSVDDENTVLQEILRVLKPGGRFLFMEHVAAPRGTWLRHLQRFFRPAWRIAGDGCEPDRETGRSLLQAGFRRVDLDRFRLPLPLVSPHIAGVAVK